MKPISGISQEAWQIHIARLWAERGVQVPDRGAAAEWIVAARGAGFVGPIFGGPGLGSALLIEIGGEAVEGVFYVSPFPWLQGDLAFKDGYQALSGGAPPGPVAAWAYEAAGRLLNALDAAALDGNGLDRAAVAAALASLPGEELGAHAFVVHSGKPFQVP